MSQYASCGPYPGYPISTSAPRDYWKISATSMSVDGEPLSGILSQVMKTPKLAGTRPNSMILKKSTEIQIEAARKPLRPISDMPSKPSVLILSQMSTAPAELPVPLRRTYPPWIQQQNGEIFPVPKPREDKTWRLLAGDKIPIAKLRHSLMKKKVKSDTKDPDIQNGGDDRKRMTSGRDVMNTPVEQDTPEFNECVTEYAKDIASFTSQRYSPIRRTHKSNFYINTSFESNSNLSSDTEDTVSKNGRKLKTRGPISQAGHKIYHWMINK